MIPLLLRAGAFLLRSKAVGTALNVASKIGGAVETGKKLLGGGQENPQQSTPQQVSNVPTPLPPKRYINSILPSSPSPVVRNNVQSSINSIRTTNQDHRESSSLLDEVHLLRNDINTQLSGKIDQLRVGVINTLNSNIMTQSHKESLIEKINKKDEDSKITNKSLGDAIRENVPQKEDLMSELLPVLMLASAYLYNKFAKLLGDLLGYDEMKEDINRGIDSVKGFSNEYLGTNFDVSSKDGMDSVEDSSASTNSNWNEMNTTINYLNKNAKDRSTGLCSKYVRTAIQKTIPEYRHPASAKDSPSRLMEVGFKPIYSGTGNSFPNAQKGDIYVIDGFGGHPHGHIAMYNGEQWVSDFKQKGIQIYRGQNRPFTVFRRIKDTKVTKSDYNTKLPLASKSPYESNVVKANKEDADKVVDKVISGSDGKESTDLNKVINGKKISESTVEEIMDLQKKGTINKVGKYNASYDLLDELIKSNKITKNDKFNEETQRKIKEEKIRSSKELLALYSGNPVTLGEVSTGLTNILGFDPSNKGSITASISDEFKSSPKIVKATSKPIALTSIKEEHEVKPTKSEDKSMTSNNINNVKGGDNYNTSTTTVNNVITHSDLDNYLS